MGSIKFFDFAQNLARKDGKGLSGRLWMTSENSELDFERIFGFDSNVRVRKWDKERSRTGSEESEFAGLGPYISSSLG